MKQSEFNIAKNLLIDHIKATMVPDKPLVFWIDLFCGAGGTSTGIQFSGKKNMFVVACVNHDENAINSHEANHPHTLHFREDIRDFAVVEQIKALIDELRKLFPGCIINLWASLECTNFSNAKGGQARDADSRSLADHMPMYLIALKPNYFWIENVREFMAWGPLDSNGKPESRTAGKDYVRWVENIKSHGYKYDKEILNSANFGAYQSRQRLFIQFAGKGMPIAWPEQTHTKDKRAGGMFQLPSWKPVRDVLDLQDEGTSIFQRKKPLSENTLKRIYAGLEKFVAKGQKGFTKQYNSGSDNCRVKSYDEPIGSVTTENSHAVVNAEHFIAKYFSGRPAGKVIGIDGPAGTVKTIDGQSLITSNFITQRQNIGDLRSKNISIDGPARTITTTGGNKDIVTATHLNTYYGKGGVYDVEGPSPSVTTKDRISKIDVKFLLDYQYKSESHSLEDPAPTLLTKDKFAKVDVVFIDQQYGMSKPSSIEIPIGSLTGNPKFALVKPQFVMNQYTGGGQHTDIDGPAATVTNVPKSNLISGEPWIMNTNFDNVGSSIDQPAQTLTASRRHPYLINANSSTCPPNDIDNPAPSITSRTHLLINPSWFGHITSTDEPSITIIARQDKSPIYLMTAESGPVIAVIYDDDSETMIRIKAFMVEYSITDIKMRMLKIPELKKIQGFPEDYILKGTQTDQKKYIGNAVEVTMAKALTMTNYDNIPNSIAAA